MEILGHDQAVRRYGGHFECHAYDDRSFSHGVHCSDCEFTVHNKCAFVFSILETLEHPSDVGHCLKLLTKGALDHTDPKCHICGKNTNRLLYHCTTCELNLDIDCMMDGMCAQAHLNMSWHHHPLLMLDFGYEMRCKVCGAPDGYGYFCPQCRLTLAHEKCVSVFDSPEINHHFHGRHHLKLLTDGAPSYTDPECHVHEHEHTLTLIPRLISFVWDACRKKGDRAPYVCFQCDLMFFHQDCAILPLVINVNRHDHIVSYKYPIGFGQWDCRICLDIRLIGRMGLILAFFVLILLFIQDAQQAQMCGMGKSLMEYLTLSHSR